MLTQLKSFFRPRNKKEPNRKKQSVNVISFSSDMKRANRDIDVDSTAAQERDTEEERKRAAEMAARVIEEERQRKVRLPSYPGLEQYEIIKKLGDGAFSNVYKARDTRTGRKVAIKVVRKNDADVNDSHLHPNLKKRPRATERANILKEVQIMRNVKHDNIIQLIQFLESNEHYYLVLELCEGGELFHRIVKLTYFSEALARHVITQVAQSVRYLHEECGVVHRDIKPENILFDPIAYIPSSPHRRGGYHFDEKKEDEGVFVNDVGGGGIGTVKLADFGLSKVIWDSSTWTPCGTVGYTAPEIVRDQRYSKSVDMWAIGCVLYTLLCGFPPFYDESIHNLTEKVANGQYAFLSPWWDPISDAAKDIITRLLCVDPNERYTIDQFLRHPWVTGQPFVPQNIPSNSPFMSYQSRVSTATSTSTMSDFESPQSRKDAFSPGVPSIKEILDITYAVQRMGEEKTWQGSPKATEEDDDMMFAENADTLIARNKERQRSNPLSAQQLQAHQPKPSKPRKKDHVKRHKAAGFELNMNNATLLKKRHQPAPAAAC